MSSYIYEIIEHETGEPNIFITSIGHSSYHWHYDYELILVLKGSVLLTVGAESLQLKENDVYLVNSKTIHALNRVDEDNLCLFIQLNSFLFHKGKDHSRYYHFYLNSQQPELAPQNGFASYCRLAALIGLESQKGERSNPVRIRAYTYELIADLFDYAVYDVIQAVYDAAQENDAALLMEIIRYVHQHYQTETVAEDACKAFGMSDKTMYRFLKKQLGFSLKDMIMEKRLEQARYYLKYEDKAIGWIASECGFGSETTFYRAFRKSTGISPAEYRSRDIKLDMPQDTNVRGYLSFNPKDAYTQLLKLSKEEQK